MDKETLKHNKNSLSESRDRPQILSPKIINDNIITPLNKKKPAVPLTETNRSKQNQEDKFTTILNILKKHSEERHEKDLLVMMPIINEIAFFKQKNIQGQDLIQICSELKHEYYKEGEAVFRQGEYGDKFYVILKGEVAVKIPDPKRKNDPPKSQIQKQPTIPITVKQSIRSQVAQESITDLRRPTILSMNTIKFLPDTKNTSSKLFLTGSNEPSPKTTKFSNNIQSLSQYSDQVKTKRRLTVNYLNPGTFNKLSMGARHMMIKDNKSHIHNNDIQEGEFEDSDGEGNQPPTILSEDSKSEDDDEYEIEQINSQESIQEYSAQDLASVIARAKEEDEGFIQVAKLVDGSSFGELALLEQKPRAATIRCLQNSHFMVLSKNDYVKVIGKIERRAYNDKINFLRNIPVFSLLTRTSLGKMTYYFDNKNCIRDSILYKEGDNAEYVYIIKSGEFEATKRIVHTGPKAENIEEILENPIKANKHKNNLFSKNTLRKIEKINLFILGQGQLIGDEDVGINCLTYQTTVRCLSQNAELIRLKKEDFIRLQSQGPTWNEILKSITEKKKKIQICLLQSRASKNRIENQFVTDTKQSIKTQKQEKVVYQTQNEGESRFRRSQSNNHTSQRSLDITNQSQQGMKFQDMIKMLGGAVKYQSYQDSDFGDATQSSLPTIQDNRQIFLSLKQAQLSQSTDRNKMSQTIRFHSNQLKTLKPQASLFPQNLQYKMVNESQISNDSYSQQQYQTLNNVARQSLQNTIIINPHRMLQSDEFSLKSQQGLKMQYRLKRRLEKIGLSHNFQPDQLRNKNPFGSHHDRHLSMNYNNNNVKMIETERSLINKTTLEGNTINRNEENSLRNVESFISSADSHNKTVILTKPQHVN